MNRGPCRLHIGKGGAQRIMPGTLRALWCSCCTAGIMMAVVGQIGRPKRVSYQSCDSFA